MNAIVKIEAREAHMLPANLGEASRIAEYIAASGLFGCKTKEQAFSLMLLADAEGLHPAAAARDYHIIEGKPSLKADAMLARYMGAGGKIKWLAREPECVSAEFSHPSSGAVTITWDKARATLAGFWNKANWKKHPTQMLSARVISEGVRASFPGVVSGVYTPEEVMDLEPAPASSRAAAAPVAIPREQPAQPAAEAEYVDAEPVSASVVSSPIQEQAPAPDKATVQTNTKANSRTDFAAMQEEIRRCTSSGELKQWGKANAKRVGYLPDDWKAELRAQYSDLLAGLEYQERAAAEADQYEQELQP